MHGVWKELADPGTKLVGPCTAHGNGQGVGSLQRGKGTRTSMHGAKMACDRTSRSVGQAACRATRGCARACAGQRCHTTNLVGPQAAHGNGQGLGELAALPFYVVMLLGRGRPCAGQVHDLLSLQKKQRRPQGQWGARQWRQAQWRVPQIQNLTQVQVKAPVPPHIILPVFRNNTFSSAARGAEAAAAGAVAEAGAAAVQC